MEIFLRFVLFRDQVLFLTVLEVEPVEVHSLHQVSQSLRLEGRQSGVADFPESRRSGWFPEQRFARPHAARRRLTRMRRSPRY